MTKPRRRQAGEGTIGTYDTKTKGTLFLAKWGEPQADGTTKPRLKRGFPTRKAAADHLREVTSSIARGVYVAPNKVTVEDHFKEWVDSLRKQPSTVASYRKNVRLHVIPALGQLRLEQLTGTRLTKHYKHLEESGRVDGKGGLSARTVRYVHTIIHSALGAAVRDGLLLNNPADKADPPTAKEAESPEMHPWTAGELRAFLDQRKRVEDELLPAWSLLASTGMRRGEALALRWGDVDWTASRLSIRRAVTLIKNKGEKQYLIIGKTKGGKPRVVDLDAQTLAMLKAHKVSQGSIALSLARDDAYVLGNLQGTIRHPERFSRRFRSALKQARDELGKDSLPEIRLHDLRHTHATLLLAAGVPVKVVSERLGHANATITLGVYAHVMPGMQQDAAEKFGALLYGGTA